MGDGAAFGCVACLVVVALALPAILVPLSFSGLEYHEYGFARQKSTGSVDTSEVYGPGGLHFIGPDYEFKKFDATDHHFGFEFSVFTKDKLSIRITVYFQYWLRKEHLATLHKFYDIHYEKNVHNQALAAMKIETPRYTTNEFIRNRTYVSEGLFRTVREKLGGSCCALDCESWDHACPDGCTEPTSCEVETQGGLWVDVRNFQLASVKIPEFVQERFMEALTLQEKSEREHNIQEAKVVRKEATQEVAEIHNRAGEVKKEAVAIANLLESISRANYTSIVEKARSRGLRNLYTRLGIKDEKIKNSFDYLRTLRGLDHVHLTVDFQQRIVGGFGRG